MPEVTAEIWAAVLEGRAKRPPPSWRSLAAATGVSRPSLQARWAKHVAAEKQARAEAKAVGADADPARPETLPAAPRKPGEPIPLPPLRSNGPPSWPIGSTAPDPYLDWDPRHVSTRELIYDDAPNIDLSERLRARPAPDPHRAHR